MSVDVLYFAFNRLEFTRATFRLLVENTDWSIVRRLAVFDDGSSDGTRQFLDDYLHNAPVDAHLTHCGWGSPVTIMNHYLDDDPADTFAKIDNDIAVPPGWLEAMTATLERHRDVELLGMEAGQTDTPETIGRRRNGYGVQRCSHTGGVGLFRSSAFLRRPRPVPHGRHGFTNWQHQHRPARAWITPDLRVPQFDRIPEEPWLSLSEVYRRKLWAREWPPYEPWQRRYWSWLEAALA